MDYTPGKSSGPATGIFLQAGPGQNERGSGVRNETRSIRQQHGRTVQNVGSRPFQHPVASDSAIRPRLENEAVLGWGCYSSTPVLKLVNLSQREGGLSHLKETKKYGARQQCISGQMCRLGCINHLSQPSNSAVVILHYHNTKCPMFPSKIRRCKR